ncbi:hypothetical protein ABW21_db0200895 [Orbilia brochopaga]|nr:hypothetical protein ABW21_db0200895 [Drechslerella brochopaga]
MQCRHQTPRPAETPDSVGCSCNKITGDTSSPTPCPPCVDFLTEHRIEQDDYIQKMLYNRNLTYFLQASREFGLSFDRPPEDIEHWAPLPGHVRFVVDSEGILKTGMQPDLADVGTRSEVRHKKGKRNRQRLWKKTEDPPPSRGSRQGPQNKGESSMTVIYEDVEALFAPEAVENLRLDDAEE